jgi:hypothetical protein
LGVIPHIVDCIGRGQVKPGRKKDGIHDSHIGTTTIYRNLGPGPSCKGEVLCCSDVNGLGLVSHDMLLKSAPKLKIFYNSKVIYALRIY